MRRLAGSIVVVVALSGCGVSAERVGVLEAQVKKLEEAQAGAQEGGGGAAALTARVDAVEAAATERFKKVEDMMELLQKGVAEAAAAKPADATSAAASPGAEVWVAVDTLLGISAPGVEVNGDSYTVKRAWLAREIEAMATGGKGPKLAPAKPAGLAVKMVKPKSAIDLLGIKNGDVVLAIGETAVNAVEELSAALKKATSPTSVKILRKKKEVVLQYTLQD